MNEDTAKLALDWIVQTISERKKDADKEARADKDDSYKAGVSQAYFEVMDIINSRIKIADDMSE